MANTNPQTETPMAPPLSDEADIGSGEKTPAQLETEQMIREIPPLPPGGADGQTASKQESDGKGDAAPSEAGLP